MSMETPKDLQFESELYAKLLAAEKEAELTDKRYSSEDVLEAMRDIIRNRGIS